MPLFRKSKKAQDAKKQDEAAAPKPAPYRHVPKHAASDARNHGLAEDDKTAQQKRIMAASQQRLNSMNLNYPVKSNFTNVPINGSQSKSFVFAASNSSRQNTGNAKGRDESVMQPGSPAGGVQTSRKAQEEYVKLRNPSLLSNTTAAGSSSSQPTLAVKNPTAAAGIDSGYGSVGQVSRSESKAPSTISKAPSEFRNSQEVKSVHPSTTGVDFLPKLDFTPESSRPTTSTDQATPPVSSAKPVSIVISRDRAVSNSSSYVSRLDPGSDRRSIASFQSKPFDKIDFSKPGQQFVPPSVKATSQMSTDSAGFGRPESPIIQSNSRPPPFPNELSKDQNVQQPTPIAREARPETRAQPGREMEVVPQPPQSTQYTSEPTKHAEESRQNTIIQKRSVDHDIEEGPSLQSTRNSTIDETESATPTAVASEDRLFQPQTMQFEPAQTHPTSHVEDGRGRRTPRSAVTTFPPVEENRRSSSTSQSRRSERTKPHVTRHTNWSRPSQSSSSQLDYERKESNSGLSLMSANPPAQTLPENDGQNESHSFRETDREARDSSCADPEPYQHTAHIEQASQTQDLHRWNDQASSIYGDSAYNASTRQHSTSRRQSFAPSEMLDHGLAAGKPAPAPLSILEGLKVNKRGKILDEEGDPIGELVEGDIIDCVRQKANAFGQVLDDYGRVVGRVSTNNRGGDVRSQSPATTVRSRGFSDFRQDYMQRYALPESQVVSPATPTLGKPFERTIQEEDPRQRAAGLQAAAARRSRRSTEAHIELDGSGYAEAAPLVDHSEIFAPPFIPSRSPKRSPAEPAPHAMDSYFSPPVEKSQPPPEEPRRLKKWASRNLEEYREEMQKAQQAPQPPNAASVPSEHAASRPSTTEATSNERDSAVPQGGPNTAVQDLISSDQPKDIFPWMTNPAPQDTGKWSSNVFTYKGEVPSEDANSRTRESSVRTSSAQSQSHPTFATNSAPLIKHYMPHLAGTPSGSRNSNRTSFREHVPHVKSPLSTHNITTPETSASAGVSKPTTTDDNSSTPRPSSSHTDASTSTAQRKKTYFSHAGRQSMMVPDTKPTHTGAATPAAAAAEPPLSPTDGAIPPPDVVRTKGEAKRKSRWSMGFGKKAPPVQNLLKK